MKRTWLLFLPLVSASSLLFAQDSSRSDWIRNPAMGNYKAYAEFKMANYDGARHVWEVLAGVGNTDALFNLAVLAEDGLGEPRDINKAEALYIAAADAGNFKSQYRLGMLYSSGGILEKDLEKARYYLSLASAAGDRDAATRLQSLAMPERPLSEFEQAEIISSSGKHAEAASLYRRLATQGDARSQTRLAWMYEAGLGVERSLDEAARRFAIAAEAGEAEAQYALAVMFRTGKGQPVDIARSQHWLERAAAQGYPPALAATAAMHKQNGNE